MSCGYEVRFELGCCFEEDVKLDFPIAQDVWIGRTASAVLGKHVIHDARLVFSTEIYGLKRNVEGFCHQHGVGRIL